MELWESGLLRHWMKELAPKAEKCFAKLSAERKKESAKQVPIRLPDLVSAFLILGVGVGLAIFSFLLELIYANFKRDSNLRSPIVLEEI